MGMISVGRDEKPLKSNKTAYNSLEGNWNASNKKKYKGFILPKLKVSLLVLPIVSVLFSVFAVSSGDIQGKIFAKLDRYVSAGKGVALQSLNKERATALVI